MAPPPNDWLNINGLLKNYQNSLTAKSAVSGYNPRSILMNTHIDWNTPPGGITGKQNRGGPSVVSRIFDILSRPNYAMAEGARQLVQKEPGESGLQQTGDVLHGLLSGIAGTRKTTFSDVYKEDLYNRDPSQFTAPTADNQVKHFEKGKAAQGEKGAAATFGLLGDIFLDPTTYIGPGVVKAAGRAIGIGKKVEKAAEPIGTKAFNTLPKVGIPGELPPALRNLPAGLESAKIPGGIPTPPSTSKSAIFQRPVDTTFPKVNLDTAALTATNIGTNAKIKALISTLSETPVKGLGKMNKTKLTEALAKVQGVETLSKSLSKDLGEATKIGGDTLNSFAQVFKLPIKATKLGDPALNLKNTIKAQKIKAEQDAALELAKKYEQSTLSQSNKFPTQSGVKPAVNNPAQQTNFFNDKLLAKAKELYPQYGHAGHMVVAHRMLKSAEDYFHSKGLNPKFWDGTETKLSDIMNQVPGGPGKISKVHLTQLMTALKNKDVSKIDHPEFQNVVHGIVTQNKLNELPYVDQALQTAGKQADVAEEVLSKPGYEAFKSTIKKKLDNVLSPQSAAIPIHISPATRSIAKDSLSTILKANVSVPQRAINAQKTAIADYVKNGGKSKWAPMERKQTQAINKTIGGPSPAKLGTKLAGVEPTEHWFFSRVATWYGNKTLRPDVLIASQSAAAKATARARVLNDVAKNFNPDEIKEAFKVAQSHLPSGQSRKIDKLGKDFRTMVENLYSHSGLEKFAVGNTVALRSGIIREDINNQLKMLGEKFQFSNHPKTPNLLGSTTDYSKGGKWLESWQDGKIGDPLAFIMKLQTATEQLTAKYSFLDELAARYGSSTRVNGFSEKVGHFRLSGTYFHPDIAKEAATVLKNWDQVYDPKSPLVKFIDQATSIWKTGVTIYAPSHHVRNIIGDIYMSWMAGVNSPSPYRLAAKVLRSQKGRYKDVTNIDALVGRNALTLPGIRSGTKPLFRTKSGIDVTDERLYIGAFQNGLLQSVNVIEDINKPFKTPKPFGGKVSEFVKSKSETREHYAKLAHFIDVVKKSRGSNLEQIMKDASKEVRKWHPDGMDLTDFERKYMRRMFPFYSWTRKAIPLIIESAVMHPGKTVMYPKVMQNLQVLTGTEGPSRSDPFPEDQLFPNWIKEKGIGPIAANGMGGIPGFLAQLGRSRTGVDGNPEGYTVVNPNNPFTDVIGQFGGMGSPKDVLGGIGQMANPFARIPAEVTTGHTMLGTPTSYDPNKYITENVPGLAYASQLGNVGIFGPTSRGQKEGLGNLEGLVNFLTALGVRGTGASIKEAEFEARQRAKNGG